MPPQPTNALITLTTDTQSLYVLRQVARQELVMLTRLGHDRKAEVIRRALDELAAAMQEARDTGNILPIIYDWNRDDIPLGGGW